MKNKLALSDWANVAEVVGGLAVVISLLYVGVQINENTEEVRATSRQQLVTRSADATGNAASNPELATALGKAEQGTSFAPEELWQYQYFVRGMFYDIQEAYLLYTEGHLDRDYWLTRKSIFQAYVVNPLALEVYMRDRKLGILHKEFAAASL
ncbi:MAG: hypothetical protein O3A63_14435 [Proteobacteria bacterium]|nr:hypothetical protein [Pseudomonadota bacterium]